MNKADVGPAPALHEVARRVIEEYLGVEPHESFVIVTDSAVAPEIADALLAAAFARDIDAAHVRIKARKTSGAEPPPAVASAMIAADVCLCITGRSLYHTKAKGEAQAAGARGCFNAPPDLSAWTIGAMTADFLEIRQVAERLADRLRGAQWVRVTSPA